MQRCETLIRNAQLLDGSGAPAVSGDLAIDEDRIVAMDAALSWKAEKVIDATGLALAPGFIDVHTHDDTAVLHTPEMLPKLSQGVTTVVVGNCGISASPLTLRGPVFDPLHLLGDAAAFRYPTFLSYVEALQAAQPAVNVGALVGHTSLRGNHLSRLDRAATPDEVAAMRVQLREALDGGALGLSTGLAYPSAIAATTEEVAGLAEPLAEAGAIYTTHMRSETEGILDAIRESCAIGQKAQVPVVISHLKCAGIANWGRSGEVLAALEGAEQQQAIGWDCYPYAAGSSTLDLRQVDERVKITVTWSEPFPEHAGRTLAEIAEAWQLDQVEAARRLQPAGAIYHSIDEDDMRAVLKHPLTMIGSDGLPLDPRPHPRLWGTFPRVLGRYARELQLFSMAEAVRKMTSLPAQRFGVAGRGRLQVGNYADLVLFDPATVEDKATYTNSVALSEGIRGVWVNGVLSYADKAPSGVRAGRFLKRNSAV